MNILTYQGNNIQQRNDGYVNATQMCQANGKQIGHWMATEDYKRYVEALAASIGIPIVKLVVVKTGRGGGTWVHPKLAIKLARWISVDFELWMDQNIMPYNLVSPQSNKDTSGFIYLAQSSCTHYYKIGMSKQPYKRMKSLQSGSPLEIILIHRIFTLDMVALEKALHEYYNAYWLRGEWFELPMDCVKEFPLVANQLDTMLEQVCLPESR